MTWHFDNHGDGYSDENVDANGGEKTALNGELYPEKDEMKSMLAWQNDDAKGMLTCQSEFHGDGEARVKLRGVKIINDYPYWLPLKFQTSSAYVTINGNEELCGSSFSDSDTSYMAGISGAWSALADEARGSMEVEWGECEDEMLASFLGEGVGEMRGE
ncbi:hypothetical protein Tco_0072058 [Tanacetum coccineum]